MEKHYIDQDIAVYCVAADAFPSGVMAAHQTLHAIFPYDGKRRFFGLSKPLNGQIRYEAAVEILPDDDHAIYSFPQRILPAGNYNTILLRDFRKDISSIGRTFETLTEQADVDPEAWCVEWYQGMDDVLCLLRVVR